MKRMLGVVIVAAIALTGCAVPLVRYMDPQTGLVAAECEYRAVPDTSAGSIIPGLDIIGLVETEIENRKRLKAFRACQEAARARGLTETYRQGFYK